MTKTLIQSFILPEGISDGITLALVPTDCRRNETHEVPPQSAGKASAGRKVGNRGSRR